MRGTEGQDRRIRKNNENTVDSCKTITKALVMWIEEINIAIAQVKKEDLIMIKPQNKITKYVERY